MSLQSVSRCLPGIPSSHCVHVACPISLFDFLVFIHCCITEDLFAKYLGKIFFFSHILGAYLSVFSSVPGSALMLIVSFI